MSIESETHQQKPTIPIKKKLMDYLARRDHSEFELRRKLSKSYESAEIDTAIEWARKNKWLPEPENASEKLAEALHRKYKGIEYINQYLNEKGLPPVGRDDELELEKARYLIKNKSSSAKRPEEQKLIRFLVSRGFESEVIRKVIDEKL